MERIIIFNTSVSFELIEYFSGLFKNSSISSEIFYNTIYLLDESFKRIFNCLSYLSSSVKIKIKFFFKINNRIYCMLL